MGKKIENCVICNWCKENDAFLHPAYCNAQGSALAKDVYGNKKCKALFSESEKLRLSDKAREERRHMEEMYEAWRMSASTMWSEWVKKEVGAGNITVLDDVLLRAPWADFSLTDLKENG